MRSIVILLANPLQAPGILQLLPSFLLSPHHTPYFLLLILQVKLLSEFKLIFFSLYTKLDILKSSKIGL